jgi:hypothetical protein
LFVCMIMGQLQKEHLAMQTQRAKQQTPQNYRANSLLVMQVTMFVGSSLRSDMSMSRESNTI